MLNLGSTFSSPSYHNEIQECKRLRGDVIPKHWASRGVNSVQVSSIGLSLHHSCSRLVWASSQSRTWTAFHPLSHRSHGKHAFVLNSLLLHCYSLQISCNSPKSWVQCLPLLFLFPLICLLFLIVFGQALVENASASFQAHFSLSLS